MNQYRYIIVLDRFDDDDLLSNGREPRTDREGCYQVAAELQEAMNETGQPAGFFNVIARHKVLDPNTPAESAHTIDPVVLARYYLNGYPNA